MSPVSESIWGVPGYVIFWILFAVAFGLFAHRLYFLYQLMRLGKDENRSDNMGQRVKSMLFEVIPQWCNLKSVKRGDFAGLGHALLFWGFSLFLISYVVYIGLAAGFGLFNPLDHNAVEKVYFSVLDLAAVVVASVLIWAAIRRYIVRPERLEPSGEAAIIMIVVFSLMVLSVAMEAFGQAAFNIDETWPVISSAIADSLRDSSMKQGELEATYQVIWWLHYAVILGFTVYIPRAKHLHILISPANVLFRPLGPKVVLEPIPMEETDNFGIARLQDCTWKDLMDLGACAVCGRCHANCPAQLSGKSLSPREMIHHMKDYLLEDGPKLLPSKTEEREASAEEPVKSLIGDVVTEDEIWACTTCGACQEVCPVGIEHIRKIIGFRRNLTMVQNKMPETAQVMLRNMQSRMHPWAGVQSLRLRGDWTQDQNLKILEEGDTADTLFWVGCTGALVERNVEATLAMTRVLKAAGVDFAVLGDAEVCCGDPARRAGYEFQFQLMAEQNIEVLQGHGIKKIITTCPHCYNTLKTEYPQFGSQFEVVHYTELIADLIKQGKLELINAVNTKLTYHDPCYLGRYAGVYEAPRQILQSIPGVTLTEMERCKKNSFCCGGGGGHMWIEEEAGTTKINHMRMDQVLKTEADTVVGACPYCLQMFQEGIEQKDIKDSLKAVDLIELVDAAMKQP